MSGEVDLWEIRFSKMMLSLKITDPSFCQVYLLLRYNVWPNLGISWLALSLKRDGLSQQEKEHWNQHDFLRIAPGRYYQFHLHLVRLNECHQTGSTVWLACIMMPSSHGNTFRVTGYLCVEFIGLRWIPRTKASDAELWCFLWSAPE